MKEEYHRLLPEELYSSRDVRAIDRYAIDVLGIPGIELMNRAGKAALSGIRECWPEARTLSVIAGSGNNGGDGYVLARLALAEGLDVRVYPVSSPDKLKNEALTAFQEYKAAGGALLDFIPEDFEAAEILADGLLGTGIDRPVTGVYAEVIRAINRYSERRITGRTRHVFALDIPSGLHADHGTALPDAVRADLTLTFVGLKKGMFTGEGLNYCGDILFSDLAIPIPARQQVQATARLLPFGPVPLPARLRSAHKGQFGHVLIVGGDLGFGGAARMAGEAAARIGAGLISIATHPRHAELLTLNRPEIMCHGVTGRDQLNVLLQRAGVVALGPGLGLSDWAKELMETVLESNVPLVVDADALNLLAMSPKNRDNWILTPHPGEAGRLLGSNSRDIQSDRYGAITELQNLYGGVIVLKGSGTLIKDLGSIISVCMGGNPGMASGGMGDVLTGVIAGLVAQGLSLSEAAERGVMLHAGAGDAAAAECGERGLLATDLLPYLRQLNNQASV